MGERKHDKLLGIRTVGLREWKDGLHSIIVTNQLHIRL